MVLMPRHPLRWPLSPRRLLLLPPRRPIICWELPRRLTCWRDSLLPPASTWCGISTPQWCITSSRANRSLSSTCSTTCWRWVYNWWVLCRYPRPYMMLFELVEARRGCQCAKGILIVSDSRWEAGMPSKCPVWRLSLLVFDVSYAHFSRPSHDFNVKRCHYFYDFHVILPFLRTYPSVV